MTKGLQKLSYDQVIKNFGVNKLRTFPGRNKGKARLMPYAKPVIRTSLKFNDDPKFFVAGNCYGRQIEQALHMAGYPILSHPKELNLPGSVLQQHNRYNVYHGDIATNEIAWAIDPKAPPLEDAFVVVEDEWADMQLNFTFAHPEEQAKEYRKSFNATYQEVKNSDVIIVTTGGIEVWFDVQTGLYMNSQPNKQMVDLYPDRFELHRFDVEHCEKSLHRSVTTILDNTDHNPVIFLTASPVFQPTVFNTADSLIEQTYARACQRVAAERVAAEYDQVEYLPGMEFADLSDRKFGFSSHSYNHTLPCMSTRLAAEMLDKYEGPSPAQKMLHAIGHCEALIIAEDYEDAAKVCEDAIESDTMLSVGFDIQYLSALQALGRGADACDWIMQRLPTLEAQDGAQVVLRATTLIRMYGTIEQILEFLDVVRGWDSEHEAIAKAQKELSELIESGAAEVGGSDRPMVQEIKTLFNKRDFDSVVARSEALFEKASDPSAKTGILSILDKVFYLTGYRPFLPFLLTAVEEDPDLPPQWKRKAMQIARGSKDPEMIDRVMGLKAHFEDINGHENFFNHMEDARAQLFDKAS